MTNMTLHGLKSKLITTATAVGFVFSASAQASLIDGIVDQWTVLVATQFDIPSVTPPPPGVTVVSPTSLRWGTSAGGTGQSGLDIGNTPTSGTVVTDGAATPNITITHFNQPITGTTLTDVIIRSSLTLTPLAPPGFPALPSATVSFPVHYAETPNGANPCADGGANGVGVNDNGCADIFVTVASLNFPFFYDLDGPAGPLQNQKYYISFFEMTHGLNPLSNAACAAVGEGPGCLGFETREQANTTVQFASLITTEPVHPTPEPGSLALAGLGLAAVGLRRRRLNWV